MSTRKLSNEELIEQLANPKADKRRTAAKRMRQLRDPVFGPPLLAAIKAELGNKRTWSAQCCMLAALADSGWRDDAAGEDILDAARNHILKSDHTTMRIQGQEVHMGDSVQEYLGFAAVKLKGSIEPLMEFISMTDKCKSRVVLDTVATGALWAMAQLEVVPSAEAASAIWDFVKQQDVNGTSSHCGDQGVLYEPFLIAASRWNTLPLRNEVADVCASSSRRRLSGFGASVQQGAHLDTLMGTVPSDPD